MEEARYHRLLSVAQQRQFNLTVVMENIQDPHNIAAVMRTCEAVGIQDIHVLNTRIPRHPKFGKSSSSSAKKWLTIHVYDDLKACHDVIAGQYQQILSTHLGESSPSLYQMDFTPSTALVFGNEHSGVSPAFRELCTGNFIIPQVGMISSLNVSVACAVTLYEAFRQKTAAGHYAKEDTLTPSQQSLFKSWCAPYGL
jgi:tRNA (guanosine-2'-O-)-methyltransferase